MTAIFKFFETLGAWGILFSLVAGTFFVLFRDLHEADAERRDIVEFLRRDEFLYRYRYAIRGALNWVSLQLCAREIHSRKLNSPGLVQDARERNLKPFSYGLLDFSIFIALFYPVVGLLVQWAFYDGSGAIAGTPVLSANASAGERTIAIVLLVILILLVRAVSRPHVKSKLTEKLCGWGLRHQISRQIAASMGFVIAALVAAAFAGPLAGLFEGASALIFIGAFAVGMVAAGVYLYVIFIAATLFIVGDYIGAIAFTVFFVFVWRILSSRLQSRSENPTPVLLLFVAILLFAFLAASIVSTAPSTGVGLLLFIGILPLVNGVADYVSSGATRYFLHRGTQGSIWTWAIVDGMVGFCAFMFLGFSTIAIIRVTALFGDGLLDLNLLFSGPAIAGSILSAPTEYVWLAIMLASTLIPTFLHLAVVILSLPITFPAWLRNGIANMIEQSPHGRPGSGRLGLLVLSLAVGASFTGAGLILSYGARALLSLAPRLAELIFGLFRMWAELLGVVPIY